LSGSFVLVLNNGEEEKRWLLYRSYSGLYVPSGWWRSLENFSTNALALIASDKMYDSEDYIRDFSTFCEWIRMKK
jgi:hypothetical protein